MTTMTKQRNCAKPFLKWAGGKKQLLNEIAKRLPKELIEGKITKYVEPFVGGGAVFFYLAQTFGNTLKEFYLFDINSDLTNCFKAVKNDVDSLIGELLIIQDKFLKLSSGERKDFYIKMRKKFNKEKAKGFSTKTAAKMIFLNKTCFNGLYRVNRKGEFNVPFGDYKRPKICDKQNLLAVAEVLKRAEIRCGDFTNCWEYIDKKTFVYFDPPYRPISKTASFTSYTKEDFSAEDQIKLAEFCKKLNSKGVRFLLSNSDPKNEDKNDHFFEDNYFEFHIDQVKASRAINCKGSKRGQISELLITNY